jgi:hypothetical protein
VLWRLLDGQPKVGAELAEHLGVGEATDGATARTAAVKRVDSYAAYPRATVAGYIKLNRSELHARLAEHQAECLEVQVELLSDPEFKNRAQAARAGR